MNIQSGSIVPQIYVPKYVVGPFDRVTIDGITMQGVSHNDDGVKLVDPNGRHQFFSYELFYSLTCGRKVELDRDFYKKEIGGGERSYDLVEFSDQSAAKALYQAEMLNVYLRLEAAGKSHPLLKAAGFKERRVSTGPACYAILLPIIKAEVDRISGGTRGGKRYDSFTPVDAKQFKRLHDCYVEAGYDPMSLAHKRAGGKARATPFEQEDIVLWLEFAHRFADDRKPTVANCYKDLAAEVHTRNLIRIAEGTRPHHLPCKKTFGRLIAGLDKFYVTSKREGIDEAKKRFKIVFNGVDVERPGERVEFDEWKIDLHTHMSTLGAWGKLSPEEQAAIKKARLWVTVAIDVATRCILAMRFSAKAPSHVSSLAALEMATMDKTLISEVVGTGHPWIYHLRPDYIFTDAGAAFIAQRFRMAVGSLKSGHLFPPAGEASARGTIESFFKTCSVQFMHWFAGRTHSSVVARGKYDAMGKATLNVDELNRFLVRAVVDIYHNQPHSSLMGETPHNSWLRLSQKFPLSPPPSSAQRRRWFGTTISRRVTAKGIRFLGIHYQSEPLQRLRATKGTPQVKVRIDRFNVKTISVKIENEWHEIEAMIPVPEGVSVWEWTAAAKRLRQIHAANAETNLSVLMRAVNDLRESGDAASARAELGTDMPSEADYNRAEKEMFRNFEIMDDLLGKAPELSEIKVSKSLLREGIEVFQQTIGEHTPDTPEPQVQPTESGFATFSKSGADDSTASDTVDEDGDFGIDFNFKG